MDAIGAAAQAAFARRLDPLSRAPVAVALSGGGDSLALLRLAAGWCGKTRRPLLALTVDHRLHPDSAAWTVFAGRAARASGAAWRALAWAGEKPATGLPAAARAARHALLATAAREAGARVLLTGHTLDDVREADRMRERDAPTLGRIAEWAPSPAWPEGRGVFLLRPLLTLRREALREWLRGRGEVWLEDPANADPRFARARARAALSSPSPPGEKVAPEGPDEGRLPAHDVLTEFCGGQEPSSAGSADALSPRGEARFTADGRILLSRAALQDARLLAAALLCAAGTDRPPRRGEVERLQQRLAEDGRVDATLCGARVAAGEGPVEIGRDAGERLRGGLASLALRPGEPRVWDGRFEISAGEPGWTVEAVGGRIGALGADERRGLKSIPAWARGGLPAMVREGAVRLPVPFGSGPGEARSLAAARLAGACGLMAREAEIERGHDGGDGSLTLCSAPSA